MANEVELDLGKALPEIAFRDYLIENGLDGLPLGWATDGKVSYDPAKMTSQEEADLTAALTAFDASVAELTEARVSKNREITASRRAELDSLVVQVGGKNYDANELSITRMSSVLSMWRAALDAGNPQAPATVTWLDADNIPQVLTIDELTTVANAAWLSQQVVWGKNAAAKNAVKAAVDVQGVNNVVY